MIDRSDLRCPSCRSLDLRQGVQIESQGHAITTRKQRERNGWLRPDVHNLMAKPPDPTWYKCNMCNAEFDGNGDEYETRMMWPRFADQPKKMSRLELITYLRQVCNHMPLKKCKELAEAANGSAETALELAGVMAPIEHKEEKLISAIETDWNNFQEVCPHCNKAIYIGSFGPVG